MRSMTENEEALRLMRDFARRTGVSDPERTPTRYLWTDAFAACNFLGLAMTHHDPTMRTHALELVDQVHQTLGRHRPDDSRTGWISGLDDEAGADAPTAGGLRIGKELPERGPDAPLDDRLEWSRDGQYFHYLTKWMHALFRVGRVCRDERYLRWALQLAKRAHRSFTYRHPTGELRMHYKMSIDLTRPLVASMGHHDPLDGLVTYLAMQEEGRSLGFDLDVELSEMAQMCAGRSWVTRDPLGIGGLLFDGFRLAQLIVDGCADGADGLLLTILADCANSLRGFAAEDTLARRADVRLGFRELGLAIGLRAIPSLTALVTREWGAFSNHGALQAVLQKLASFQRHGTAIELFWMTPENRRSPTWTDHLDINEVMLATSLEPLGFLSVNCVPAERNPPTP